jgi:hypothetical protein
LKRAAWVMVAALVWLAAPRGSVPVVAAGKNPILPDCSLKGKKLFGKVQVVSSFPDLKVQIVEAFPDLNVEVVEASPGKCGQWKMTNTFPELKVQFVTSFPDLKIKYVKSFPGINN